MSVGARSSRAIRFGLLGLSVAFVVACAEVTISSNRRTGDATPIDPVLFVIAEGNTPASYPRIMRHYLMREMSQRGIAARVIILTGTELDEGQVIRNGAAKMRGLVIVVPAGGTRNQFGDLMQVLYDARAFRITRKRASAQPVDAGRPASSNGDAGTDGTTADGAPPPNGAEPSTPRPSKPRDDAEVTPIWRARVNASGGGPSDKLEKVASGLVVRMIRDHVLPGTPAEIPSEAVGVPADDPDE